MIFRCKYLYFKDKYIIFAAVINALTIIINLLNSYYYEKQTYFWNDIFVPHGICSTNKRAIESI